MVEQATTVGRGNRRDAQRVRRRQALVDAALGCFATRGVAGTSVDDIVRAAGVAKGTFYLYFEAKDDVVGAVAEQMVRGVSDTIAATAADRSSSAVERVVGFGRAIRQVGAESYERDLVEIFHRPENRAIHDRMAEEAITQLRPAMTAIVADGIEQGQFRHQDPARAAAFVLACFSILHDVIAGPAEVSEAIDELDAFVLRGLGHDGRLAR